MKKILAVILTGIIAVSSITMVSATSETRITRDVNNDGAVSIADATNIQKYLANIIDLDDEAHICADTDGNGSISIADATYIQKYLAGIISDFPANQTDVPPTELTTEPIEPTTPTPTEPESENPVVGNVIPEGGQVILNGNTYNAGEEFPANETGMIFTYGDYEYGYNGSYSVGDWEECDEQNGWGVRVKDDSQETYGEILSEIAGKPVTNMSHTFMCCTYLTKAPRIPNGVTDMRYTFWSCDNLTTSPKIPSSVTNMYCTFQ